MPMLFRCHAYGKKNCEGPEGWEDNMELPWYDPKGKYGDEIPGGIIKGYEAKEIKEYFDEISEFAKYSFNKSHSACYGYLAWLTAWLKCHYTTEFMAAVITMATAEEREKYISISEQQFRITFKTPDVNLSDSYFLPMRNRTIRYGLTSIKGLGMSVIQKILEERKEREFTGIEDFVNRVKGVNKKAVISLIKAGAFDFEDKNRYRMINRFLELRMKKVNVNTKPWLALQEELVNPEDYNDNVTMELEQEVLSTTVTVKRYWDKIKPGDKIKAPDEPLGMKTATVLKLRRHITKETKKEMAFATLEFPDGSVVDATIFPSTWAGSSKWSNDPGVGTFLDEDSKGEKVFVSGKKGEKGELIVSRMIKWIELEFDEATNQWVPKAINSF